MPAPLARTCSAVTADACTRWASNGAPPPQPCTWTTPRAVPTRSRPSRGRGRGGWSVEDASLPRPRGAANATNASAVTASPSGTTAPTTGTPWPLAPVDGESGTSATRGPCAAPNSPPPGCRATAAPASPARRVGGGGGGQAQAGGQGGDGDAHGWRGSRRPEPTCVEKSRGSAATTLSRTFWFRPPPSSTRGRPPAPSRRTHSRGPSLRARIPRLQGRGCVVPTAQRAVPAFRVGLCCPFSAWPVMPRPRALRPSDDSQDVSVCGRVPVKSGEADKRHARGGRATAHHTFPTRRSPQPTSDEPPSPSGPAAATRSRTLCALASRVGAGAVRPVDGGASRRSRGARPRRARLQTLPPAGAPGGALLWGSVLVPALPQ